MFPTSLSRSVISMSQSRNILADSFQAVASSATPLFKSLSTVWRFQPASPRSLEHLHSSPTRVLTGGLRSSHLDLHRLLVSSSLPSLSRSGNVGSRGRFPSSQGMHNLNSQQKLTKPKADPQPLSQISYGLYSDQHTFDGKLGVKHHPVFTRPAPVA